MRFKTLYLENFRNFKEETINFDEYKNEIQAPNGWGKTTIADAIMWIFTGKLFSGSADQMSFKPLHDTKLKVVAELTIITGWDGNDPQHPTKIILRKEYKEDWVTSRGSTVAVLGGHTTTTYINTNKKSIQEYEKELLKLFEVPTIEWFQIMSHPFYFAQIMDWKKRREVISDIIGTIAPTEIFTKEPVTRTVEPELRAASWDVDNAKKTIRTALQGKKTEQTTLQNQIDGYVIDKTVTDEEFTKAAQKITSTMNEEANLKASKMGIKNPKVENLKQSIQDLEQSLNKSISNDNSELNKSNAAINEEIGKKNLQVSSLHESKRNAIAKRESILTEINKINLDNANDLRIIEGKKASGNVLLSEWDETEAKKFKPLEAVTCPHCGQDINDQANKVAEEEFNSWKSKELADISNKISQIKGEIANYTKAIDERKAKLQTLNQQESEQRSIIKGFEDDINKVNDEILVKKQSIRYSAPESDTTKAIREQIQASKDALRDAEMESTDTVKIDAEIEALRAERETAQSIVTSYRVTEQKVKEKAEKERAKAVIDQSIADLQVKEDALTLYSKTWLAIMDSRLKANFPDVSIRLVKENIKADSWDPDCTIMDKNGAPFDTTNTASKFFLGLGLIENLRAAKNLPSFPVLMDDVEHITKQNRNFNTTNQVITFVASDVENKLVA